MLSPTVLFMTTISIILLSACFRHFLRVSIQPLSSADSRHFFQVSNLFARDEMDEILQELIGVMKKEFPRRPPTNENLYEYYLSRVRQNLHVVLCFSPVRKWNT